MALDGADLDLLPGEVHGVLGENGAGKTTLLSILGGILRGDAGTVELGGVSGAPRSPREAWSRGVGMVHQHFTLVPRLTVLENLTLGHRGRARGWRIPLQEIAQRADLLMERTGLSVPLDAGVEELGVGERQRVEILKALLREPRVLVLDEPTAVLTPGEVRQLSSLLRELAAGGTAVALVAHKLDEVLDVSDRVTVMRDGRSVLSASRSDVNASTLTRAMVGRETPVPAAPRGADPGPEVASVAEVRVRGRQGQWALRGASLAVRRGEILGIAGVEGNGQRELALVLAGRLPPAEGQAELPSAVGFISQDRSREGLVGSFDLTENMALALHRRPEVRIRGALRWPVVEAHTRRALDTYAIRAPGPWVLAQALSGGNQQRLVVAREMAEAGDLLVAENPTRGLDVAAAAFVHQEIRSLVDGDRGMPPGVVLLSTDLDEVLALAHRVLVMVRGELLPVAEGDETREAVGALMLSERREPMS